MIYLKTYNEKLGDLLLPPNRDDILNIFIKKKTPLDKILYQSMNNNFLDGVIYVVNKYKDIHFISNVITYNIYKTSPDIIKYFIDNKKTNFLFNKEQIYILEKYILGLHQNDDSDYELLFERILLKSKPIPSDDKNFIYYTHDKYGLTLLHTTLTENIFNIDSNIWNIFERKYKLDYYLIKFLTEKMIEKYLKETNVITQKNSL